MDARNKRIRLAGEIFGWFETEGGDNSIAVIGISGGKDSTVAAALCAEALGPERVMGVLMPNGEQGDIDDSYKVVHSLGINYQVCNIFSPYINMVEMLEYAYPTGNKITNDVTINLAPRLRMATLYAVAASINGRVINTSNKCEAFVGYCTKWGDNVGDVAPLIDLTVSEIVDIGMTYVKDGVLTQELIKKTPSDGLSGLSDEEKLGFTYNEVEAVMRQWDDLSRDEEIDQIHYQAIVNAHIKSMHKRDGITELHWL